VTLLTARMSRIVVDLNRGPSGEKLYPGQVETGICPAESFAGEPYYQVAPPDGPPNGPPDNAEVARRIAAYWTPYHDTLRQLIDDTRARHGFVHVLDGHSIHGRIPRLFSGLLPDLNLGTFDGASADPRLAARVMQAMAGQGFSTVLNGRFKGGYITRHYGAPGAGVHVLQLEMAWRAYTDENHPDTYDAVRAAPLIAVLRRVVDALLRA
jgi:N-formylglutamate deformylase